MRSLIIWLIVMGLLAVAFAAALSRGENPSLTFSVFTTRFLGIFIEAVPFLLMGVVVSGVLEVYVTREDIVRWMPRNPFLATVAGSFLGFAFPVCECGVVPVTRRLFSKGLPMSVGVAFLLAAPVMNPIVLASTMIAFGVGPVLFLRFAVTAVVAIVVGAIFALAARPHEVLRPVALMPVQGASAGALPTRRE
ncbi:MAG: permease, partial [Chloroflexota bacterium]